MIGLRDNKRPDPTPEMAMLKRKTDRSEIMNQDLYQIEKR